jgi:hypothetical protein
MAARIVKQSGWRQITLCMQHTHVSACSGAVHQMFSVAHCDQHTALSPLRPQAAGQGSAAYGAAAAAAG